MALASQKKTSVHALFSKIDGSRDDPQLYGDDEDIHEDRYEDFEHELSPPRDETEKNKQNAPPSIKKTSTPPNITLDFSQKHGGSKRATPTRQELLFRIIVRDMELFTDKSLTRPIVDDIFIEKGTIVPGYYINQYTIFILSPYNVYTMARCLEVTKKRMFANILFLFLFLFF